MAVGRAHADVDDEDRAPAAVGEELAVDAGAVEAAHRAGREPDSAHADQEVGGQQRRAQPGKPLARVGVVLEPLRRVGPVRGERRKQLVVARVGRRDDGHRCGQRLGPVAFAHVRDEPFASLGRAHDAQAPGIRVAAGRRPADQVPDLLELLVGDRVRGEAVGRVRLVEQQVGSLVVKLEHRSAPRWLDGSCARNYTMRPKPRKYGVAGAAATHARSMVHRLMAKDTEKLIRQLSLISYLMAERRPVTALDIKRDVEGYSGMNEDAFARRFYADRAELESLRIPLTVEKPLDGVAEQENYSLRPENFHLPAIEFTDSELAALATALSLLDGEFAYAEPLRLALQQITWGRPSPLAAPDQHGVALGITASAGGHELLQSLAKIESAIFRHKTVTFEYFTMERGELGLRTVDPYHLLFQGGQFYLLGYAHEREALRVFRLSRIRGKVAYATKAEHDFRRPTDFDPRAYANLAAWQFGELTDKAEIRIAERIAWLLERHFE